MLTGDSALVGLLLCTVIARSVSLCSVSSASPIEVPEVAKVPEVSQVVAEASRVVRTSAMPMKPRIVQRTTVLKRANRLGREDNFTSSSKLQNYENDSTTTTRLPDPLSHESATQKTSNFRASINLGEINGYETRISSTNPFNKVQQVRFENSVKIGESVTDGARTPVTKTSSFVHGPERTTTAAEGEKRNNRVKFFETDSRYSIDVPVEHQQEYFEPGQQNEHPENNDDTDDRYHDHNHNHHHDHNYQHNVNVGYNEPANVPADHETLVTFVHPQEHYGGLTARPMTLGRPVYPSIISEQVHVQEYKPVTDNVKTIYVKPSKFHGEVEIVTPVPVPVPVLVPGPGPRPVLVPGPGPGPVLVPGSVPMPVHIHHYEYGVPASGEAFAKPEVHLHHQSSYELLPHEAHAHKVPGPAHTPHYEFGAPASGEAIEKPEVHLHHQSSYEILPHEGHTDDIGKPETVVYLTSHRETAYTRTTKFPYKFHHPGLGYQDNEYHFVEEVPHAHPSKGRISPWKKILHLIGTFIPLGLLLATLTPNIVKIGNTTQPTVVSKIRAVDLPIEHKHARLIDEPDEQRQNSCEEKSICELIIGRSDSISKLLRNILWSLTTKSPDDEVKQHDLHDILEAVKKKNCSTIDCRRFKEH